LFSINYGTCADPDCAVEVARYAESGGLESVWTGDLRGIDSARERADG
jgi:hypothetical protein